MGIKKNALLDEDVLENAAKLANELGITVAEAKKIIADYLNGAKVAGFIEGSVWMHNQSNAMIKKFVVGVLGLCALGYIMGKAF